MEFGNRGAVAQLQPPKPPARSPCVTWSTRPLVVALAALVSVLLPRTAPAVRARDLADLSLTDLMAVEVTSVSKRAERLATTPAAVTVLTNDDIRRSGATNLPDLLRLVPGVQVARAASDSWAVSIRGFNDIFADKLLVLVDGRSVYTPLFAGVYWDVQDVVLEDVERIEVIRGPGSAVWGANAVNGVINVITRDAAATRGGLASAGGGNEDRFLGTARYGGSIGESANARVYAKGFVRDESVTIDGRGADDSWYQARAGFRADGRASSRASWTIQGDAYAGRGAETLDLVTSLDPYTSQVTRAEIDVNGANLLGRWVHDFGESGETTAQAWWDHTRRDTAQLAETRETGDLELQHQLAWWSRNDLVVGVGSRVSSDWLRGSLSTDFESDSRTSWVLSGFAENRTSLVDDTVGLVLGTKLEWNDHVGFEIQPTARASWTPEPRLTLWGAVSRAIRTPSRGEEDILIRGVPFQVEIPNLSPLSFAPRIEGSRAMTNETMCAIEAGIRTELHPELKLEIAGFFDTYGDLLSADSQPLGADAIAGALAQLLHPESAPPIALPIRFGNSLSAQGYGVEAEARWRVRPWWRLTTSYTYLHIDARTEGGTDIYSKYQYEGSSPAHQLHARTSFDLPYGFELDLLGFWVDELDFSALGQPNHFPAHLRLDTRLGWRPLPELELAVVGQDLLDARHAEFTNTSRGRVLQTEVQRGIHAKATWTF